MNSSKNERLGQGCDDHTFVPLLQLFLVEMCRLLQFFQLLGGQLRLSAYMLDESGRTDFCAQQGRMHLRVRVYEVLGCAPTFDP